MTLLRLLICPFVVCVPDELPEGFSQQMQEESQKSRPRFQPAAQQNPAAPNPKVATNTPKETNKVSPSVYKCVCVISTVTPSWMLQVWCFSRPQRRMKLRA